MKTVVLFLALPVLLVALLAVLFPPPEKRPLSDFVNMTTTTYWGEGAPGKTDESIRPFEINVPESILEDLKVRLNNTRYFDTIEGPIADYGTSPRFTKELVRYWQEKYDWRKHEKFLNQYDQFKTNIDGIDVHFLHVKGKQPKTGPKVEPKPLIIVHGWPGSVYEFYQILPYLIDPSSHGGNAADVYDVVVPAIPGYGFSSRAHKKGMDQVQAGLIFAKLMKRLGYKKYIAQGGDWGGVVAAAIAGVNPENCIGVHVNFYLPAIGRYELFQVAAGSYFPDWIFSKEDQERVLPFSKVAQYFWNESGYFHEQATRPYTLAHGLTDSPAGLAAYIIEKFRVWSDCHGDVYKRFTNDQLLTNVMIYWVTNSISSAVNLYKEWNDSPNLPSMFDAPVSTPAGVIEFPKEIYSLPKSWVENKFPNLVSYTVAPQGGHFAAMEEPELLAKDLWQFQHKVQW